MGKKTANVLSLVAVVMGFTQVANASSMVPAAIKQAVTPSPYFPAQMALKNLDNDGATELNDGSVGILSAIQLPTNKLLDLAAPETAAAERAQSYFFKLLNLRANHVELTPTATSIDDGEITTYLVQTVNGVRIADTYAMAVMHGNTLTYARHFLVKAPSLATTPAVASQDAQSQALAATRDNVGNVALVPETQPALLIVFNEGEAKLAWSVEVTTEKPWGKRAVYIDAQTGAFLSYKKLSHDDVSGHVNFAVEPGCYGDKKVEVPVPFVKWNGVDYTDAEGAFTSTKSITTTKVSLESPFFRMINAKGRLAGPWALPVKAAVDNDVVVEDRALEQLDPFYHLHKVRSWMRDNVKGTNSQTRWTDKQLQVRVNINDTCNAYYDGTLNFFSAGDGCLNTSRTAGIVYHEYGHGIHHHSPAAASGLSMDGQVSEGVGDYVAATITNNPNMRGIFSCHDNFRSCQNTLTYCERGCDLSSRSEVHEAGQVICAVWWEFRTQMIAELGQDAGVKTSDRLHLKFLTKVGNMYSAYQAAIAADDDDDGDPTNGTTHSCEINKAFANDAPGAKAHFPRLKGMMVPCQHSQ